MNRMRLGTLAFSALGLSVCVWAMACGSSSDSSSATGGAGNSAGGSSGGASGQAGSSGGAGSAGGAGLGGGGSAGGGEAGAAGTAGAGGSTNRCAQAIDYSKAADQATGWVAGTIDPAGDADYYKVALKEGIFYSFLTDANPDDEPDKVDTVLSLYDESGANLLATADDSVPRVSTDSSLQYRSPTNQTVCVKVEDWSSWSGGTPVGDPKFTYSFAAIELVNTVAVNNFDTEPNDSIANAQVETFERSNDQSWSISFVHGMLGTKADIDVYQFSTPVGTTNASVYFTPSGVGGPSLNGSGSTTQLGNVDVTNMTGDVIARLDASKGAGDLSVPIQGGSRYLLWVQRPAGGTPGANDFYRLFHIVSNDDNPRETEPNNSLAAAEALKIDGTSGHVLGTLTDGDVDYFRFDAKKNERVELVCGAIRAGSGLLAPNFAIRDASDKELQQEVETELADVSWSSSKSASKPALAISQDGSYYLRVAAAGQSSIVQGNYYRCGIFLTK